jgi:hypothetical protein
MMMANRYWHHKSTKADKIQWLLNHQELWVGWNDIGDPRHREIFNEMVKDGLLSEKSYWRDLSLTKLIYEARKIRREK